MKRILGFIKTALIGGVLVVLPLWITVLLLLKSVSMLAAFIQPIMGVLPVGMHFQWLVAMLLLLGGCFLIGLIVRTTLGQWLRTRVETKLLDRLPGYRLFRGLAMRIADPQHAEEFPVALVEIEQALVPALIVEKHADGRMTVFVPSSPTPIAGSIYILTPERVHPIDVPLIKAMACISKWGTGSAELLAAMPSLPADRSVT